jgi:hypothetical protein
MELRGVVEGDRGDLAAEYIEFRQYSAWRANSLVAVLETDEPRPGRIQRELQGQI